MRTVLLLVAVFLAWTGPVHAAAVSLLRPSNTSPELTEALFRLQGELLAVGLAVEIRDRPPALASDALARNAWFDALASEGSIDAVIEILGDPAPLGVDIWIVQRSSRRFRASRVVLEPDTPNPPETLAIRAIEVLRANFLVIDVPDENPSQDGVHESPPEAPSEKPASEERFGLAAGAAVLASLGGVGPAIQPLLRLDIRLPAGFVTEAMLSGFGTRPTVATEAGSVSVAQDYAVLGLGYSIPADSPFTAFVVLCAGALRTSLQGSADSPNRGHHVDQWAFLTELSLGARLELSQRYALSLAAHVQFAAPYAAIHFVDEQVATTGRPNLLGSITLGAWL